MKITINCIGKTKKKYVVQGIKEYSKRLQKYQTIDFNYLQSQSLTKTNSIAIVKKAEGKKILHYMDNKCYNVLLDELGKQITSMKFAALIKHKIGKQDINFFIGGVYGVSPQVKQKADLFLSFSKMTFTHQMIRLLLVEQIYRAFTIIRNKKYHY